MATTWTDTLTAGTSVPRPVYIAQLRTALNTERNRRSRGSATYADSTLEVGMANRDVHIQDVRNAISSFSPLSVTDPTLVGSSTPVRVAHINELRAKINALETHPTVGGTTDCNSSCIGLCVGCTGCSGGCSGCSGDCSGGCTGCTGNCST